MFVLRNNDIGDLLIVTPLFEALAERFPQAEIVAGVGSWNADVLRHNPHVHRTLEINAPWFNRRAASAGDQQRRAYLNRSPEIETLRQLRCAIGIDVLGSYWGALLLLRAGIPFRLGTSGFEGGEAAFQRSVPFDPRAHVGRAALRFAEQLGALELPANVPQIFLAAEERTAGETAWRELAGGGRRRRVLIGPGGNVPARRWPTDHFARLAGLLAEVPDVQLLCCGGPGEEAILSEVAGGRAAVKLLPTSLDLRGVFAVTAAADVVICNSSMLMHAAAAFRKPTYVLLGASFPSAAAHQAQWGYDGLSVSLGREGGAVAVVEPERVLAELAPGARSSASPEWPT